TVPEWNPRFHVLWFLDDYVPFNFSGDVLLYNDETHAAWWSGIPMVGKVEEMDFYNYMSVLQSVRFGGSPASAWWASSAFASVTPGAATPLRNVVRSDVGYDQQALRLGVWDGHVHAVVATTGGSILVVKIGEAPDSCLQFPKRTLDPPYFDADVDHGYGGLALAVAKVPSTAAEPVIFHGTLHTHGDDEVRDMVSSLHVWNWETGQHDDYVFDGTTASRPKLYGLCG